ncbi:MULTISPECIES: phycobiliprotein lyase [unclassified Synechococcus]|uniref:phycobiliprotein lyase n=1 Tax=unclassified Synechococcus TaxID=2626047 RepID=UPI0020CF8F04|nr:MULTISPECIES: phycobiliprotein lyase [unclassified Synechococcus]
MTGPIPAPTPAPTQAFPPESLPAFLALCAGQWMGLRSRFSTSSAPGEDDDAWHSSDRGDVTVVFLEAITPGSLGELMVTSPLGHTSRLGFQADGTVLDGEASAPLGRWQLWPDGSLELVTQAAELERRERIWFTKPNLRLRSSVEHGAGGSAAQASFCSEIRRVSRP